MPFTITIEEFNEYSSYEDIKLVLQNDKNEEIGSGLANFSFDKSLNILRVDVDEDYRNRGYGFRLMLSLCQRAFSDNIKKGASSFVTEVLPVHLVADEGESAGLRKYYEKMGFIEDEEQENDRPDQYSMTGILGPVITNLQIILAAKYTSYPVIVKLK
ncbi:MAG: GNAT family N-acetyltransferase [Acidobacteria bacterium]|nr:GNAT family N-acetyltransferase [Acidobacteriota bacterium]